MKKEDIIKEYLHSKGIEFDFIESADLKKLSTDQYIVVDNDSQLFDLLELKFEKKEREITNKKGEKVKEKYEVLEDHRVVESFNLNDITSAEVDKFAMSRVYHFSNGQILRVNGDTKQFDDYLQSHNVQFIFKERKWYNKIIGFRSGTPWKMVLTVLALLVALFLIYDIATESDSEKEERLAQEAKEKADVKSIEVKQKQEEVSAEEKSTEEKVAEKPSDANKLKYKNDFANIISTRHKIIDQYWQDLWVDSMDGVGNGTMDNYTAYDNMEDLEKKYENIKYSIENTKTPDFFTKNDVETFKRYQEDMSLMMMKRLDVINTSKEMFDKNDYKPSGLSKIKDDARKANAYMSDAMAELAELHVTYDYELNE